MKNTLKIHRAIHAITQEELANGSFQETIDDTTVNKAEVKDGAGANRRRCDVPWH